MGARAGEGLMLEPLPGTDPQSEPLPEETARALLRLIPSLIRLLAVELRRAPDAAGLTLPQFKLLARLSERDFRPAELAELLEIGRPTLTAIVDGLVRRGLVERQRDLADRRGVLLRLTPAGRTLFHTVEARTTAVLGRLVAELAVAEQAALGQGLSALERRLRSAVGQPCSVDRRDRCQPS